MPCFPFNSTAGVAVLALALASSPALLRPQTAQANSASQTISASVQDSHGAQLVGATAKDAAGTLLGRSDEGGRLTVHCATPCRATIEAPGFEGTTIEITSRMIIRLVPASANEQVTVTAYRTPLSTLESPVTTRVLSQTDLRTTATITLDDQLRQLPGVELFRRSSSLVANPSSQGISLRALGSTSASRTLVTEDDVPLNDAFADTIHWQEEPELGTKSIELLRGGASDLYGSSAIGGVVNVVPLRPTSDLGELSGSYGGEGTYDDSLLLEGKRGPWGLLATGGVLGTDGYIQESPAQRGPVDIASNVHSQNGEALLDRHRGPLRLFARTSGFNEARNNGTPYQTNGTRLWRFSTGGDWQGPREGTLVARFYGATNHYRQTFSSISNLPIFGDLGCTYRCGEIPTKFSLTPDNELGAVAHWSQPLGASLVLLAGADSHDVRVWDREQAYGSSASLTNLHDHQRDSGAYLEGLWIRKAWTVSASARYDYFQNDNGQKLQWNGIAWVPAASQPPWKDEQFFDPRLGVARKLGEHWALSASGFRAFREPSPNELYRATQVGAQLTLANPKLLSERATGFEAGVASQRHWGNIRASYFLTQVNRPITAVASSPTLLTRENLGQIESKGLSVDYELAPRRWLAVDGGYQYADATVSRGTQYLGNWIPEVARNLASMNVRAFKPRMGTASLQGRLSGRQFDDAANTYLLYGYFRLDAYASHDFGSHIQIFGAGENLFNRQIEDSKTPTTTLGMPRVGRVGVLIRLGTNDH